MNIKKNSKSSVLIDSGVQDIKIENLFFNGSIVSKVITPERSLEISKPGDYEYGKVGFTGFEVPVESYKGSINLVKLLVEDIRVVILFADVEIAKDVLNELVNIDVLITPFFNSDRLKEHIADIDPKTLLILRNFESSQEVDLEGVQKMLGVGTIEEASNYKFKSGDFSNDGEYTLSTFILK